LKKRGGNLPIGAKQILLLKICKDKGHLIVRDVREVYGLPSGRNLGESTRQSKIAELKLKLLETYGYLKSQNDTYILTKLGENKIQEWGKKYKKSDIILD
jgi:hypothetical protein